MSETITQAPAKTTPPGIPATLDLVGVQTALEARAQKCLTALSAIKSIATPEEDKAANDLLVKIRKTLKGFDGENGHVAGMEEQRKKLTALLDQVKSTLMEPENKVIDEATRVKNLRDAFARDQHEKARKEAERIAREKRVQDEIARIKQTIREAIAEGIVQTTYKVSDAIKKHLANISLQNFEEKTARFNQKPKLPQELYASFFHVAMEDTFLDAETLQAIVSDIQKEQAYPQVAQAYVTRAAKVIEDWKKELPAIKDTLERIAELDAAEGKAIEAATARRRLAELLQTKAEEDDNVLQRQQEELRAHIKQQNEQDRVKNDFQAQAEQQASKTATPKGTRKSLIALLDPASPVSLEDTFIAIMRAMISNKAFSQTTNVYKYDKDGQPVRKDSFPVYAPWLQDMLDFITRNHDVANEIPGVVFKEKIKSTAKA